MRDPQMGYMNDFDALMDLQSHPGWALVREHFLEELTLASTQVFLLSPATQAEPLARVQQRCLDLNEVLDWPAQAAKAAREALENVRG